MYLGVSHTSHPKRAEFQGSTKVVGVLLYLSVHSLTLNDQFRYGNTYLEGRVFRGFSHAIAYCTNASRCLSAIADFLVFQEL